MRLIADKGFRSVTVAEIESAAGLSPGAGGFYRHFASKRALLDACLARWIDDITTFGRDLAGLVPVDDLRSELTITARGALLLLTRQRDLLRFLGRDADAFPDAARNVHDHLVTRGYDQMRNQLQRLLTNRDVDLPHPDLDALTAVALGALVHYRDDQARYGSPPAEADEEYFVAMWVDLLVTWIDSKTP